MTLEVEEAGDRNEAAGHGREGRAAGKRSEFIGRQPRRLHKRSPKHEKDKKGKRELTGIGREPFRGCPKPCGRSGRAAPAHVATRIVEPKLAAGGKGKKIKSSSESSRTRRGAKGTDRGAQGHTKKGDRELAWVRHGGSASRPTKGRQPLRCQRRARRPQSRSETASKKKDTKGTKPSGRRHGAMSE